MTDAPGTQEELEVPASSPVCLSVDTIIKLGSGFGLLPQQQHGCHQTPPSCRSEAEQQSEGQRSASAASCHSEPVRSVGAQVAAAHRVPGTQYHLGGSLCSSTLSGVISTTPVLRVRPLAAEMLMR